MSALTAEDIFRVLSTSEFGAYAIDLHQTILFWNEGAHRILGHPPGEVLQLSCHQLPSADGDRGLTPDCLRGCPALQEAREGQSPGVFQTLLLTSSGKRVPVGLTVLAVPDVLENGTMLIYVFTDGRAEKEYVGLAQALQQAVTGGLSAEQIPGPMDLRNPTPGT